MVDPRIAALQYPEPSEAMQYALLRALLNETEPQNMLKIIKSYDAARTQAINALSTELYNALTVAPAPVYIIKEPK